ncbi:MAG: glycosyltransferase family 4 protein [Candidatus Diapherotrites archaeon]
MKICIVSLFYERDYGQGLCVKETAENLAELGHEVLVLHGQRKASKPNNKNIRLHYIKHSEAPGLNMVSFAFNLRKKVYELNRKEKFDLFYPQSYEFGLVEFKELKAPVVYHARGTVKGNIVHRPKTNALNELLRSISMPFFVGMDRKCYRNSSFIIADSRKVKKEIAGYYGVKPEKIFVVPDGIDLKEFNPKISGNKIRGEYGLKSSRVMLFAGRMVPQKGLQYLIQAMPSIVKRIPNAKLLVAGANTAEPYCEKIKKLVEERELKEKVVFAGFVEHKKMPEFIAAADVVAVPSTYEPFGIINLEAMAMGKPLITTSAVGSIDVVKGYAEIIKPNSVKTISRAAVKILSRKIFKAKKKNLKEYEWRNSTKKIYKIIREELFAKQIL